MSTIASAYAQDGVSLEAGDSFSTFCGGICRASYGNSPFVEVRDWSEGKFRGPRTFRLKRHLSPECELSADQDGNGTKVIINVAAHLPHCSGCDLFAMTGMDGVRYGGCPVLLMNQLDVSTLGNAGDATNQFFRDLMVGLGETARNQRVVLLKGETAEMGVCVGSENPNAPMKYLWCGVMISVFHPNAFITGQGLRAGQVVVALREFGLRANGGSSARKAFRMKYGESWDTHPAAMLDVKAAAFPSALYENFLTDVNGWNSLEDGRPTPRMRIHAIAHITGGGIPSKLFGDILKPRRLSAVLDDLFEPPEIMRKMARWRGVSGEEPYEIWHGGQGALVILDEVDVPQFCLLAERAGHTAQPAGVLSDSMSAVPALTIKSKFDGEKLMWS